MSLVHNDLIALLPLITLATTVVAVMLVAAFSHHPRPALPLTLLGLVLSCAALPIAASVAPREVTPLIIVDRYALFYMGLIFAATFVVAVFCYHYVGGSASSHEEALYILLLAAALGATVLVLSSHFASFFLGLELLSVPLFATGRLSGQVQTRSGSRYQVSDTGRIVVGTACSRYGGDLRAARNDAIPRHRRSACGFGCLSTTAVDFLLYY
ncbi:hypothetical protein [Paraburkholderia xenovorans]